MKVKVVWADFNTLEPVVVSSFRSSVIFNSVMVDSPVVYGCVFTVMEPNGPQVAKAHFILSLDHQRHLDLGQVRQFCGSRWAEGSGGLPRKFRQLTARSFLILCTTLTPTPISRAILRIPLSPRRNACPIAPSTSGSTFGLPSRIPPPPPRRAVSSVLQR